MTRPASAWTTLFAACGVDGLTQRESTRQMKHEVSPHHCTLPCPGLHVCSSPGEVLSFSRRPVRFKTDREYHAAFQSGACAQGLQWANTTVASMEKRPQAASCALAGTFCLKPNAILSSGAHVQAWPDAVRAAMPGACDPKDHPGGVARALGLDRWDLSGVGRRRRWVQCSCSTIVC